MNNNNDEETLGLLNRLLEQVHQAGISKIDNLVFVVSGAQYVDHVENQYFYGDTCRKSTKTPKKKDESATKTFNDETPLSALFRENHHEELRKIIESWRPYLIGDDASIDVMSIYDFQFDLTAIRPVSIYMDLTHLINHDALRPPMSVLAAYMFQHSNLSRSESALYVQLKRYRKMCE